VYTEMRTVLRAVVTDFFFNCWCWRSLGITIFGTYEGASTVVHKTLDWESSRISMYEVEAVPRSCIS
jgi:hypothetical protein